MQLQDDKALQILLGKLRCKQEAYNQTLHVSAKRITLVQILCLRLFHIFSRIFITAATHTWVQIIRNHHTLVQRYLDNPTAVAKTF